MHELGTTHRFDPFPPRTFGDDDEHRRDANRALVLSALGLSVTGGIELVIALLSGSVGLLGDAIHNLADVWTSLVAFVGLRVSRRSAGPSHPYGYERAEDLVGLGVALVIWASAVFAGYVSIHKLIHHGSTSHLWLGVAAAIVGIVGNRVVARYNCGSVPASSRTPPWPTPSTPGSMRWPLVASLLGLVACRLLWADGGAGLLVTASSCTSAGQ